MSPERQVVIYTDGACLGNPGPGGWAAVLLCAGKRREISGGRRWTTNNRMELLAAIEALRALTRPCQVTLFSDSTYLVNGATQGRMYRGKERVPNGDLWAALDESCSRHQVTFQWVRGHRGCPENERCDQLSAEAASQGGLPEDEGYGKPPRRKGFLFAELEEEIGPEARRGA